MTAENKTALGLHPQERLVDLGVAGLRLIQRQDFFCPGEDSALLAAFAEISPADKVLELGCGNGSVLLLLYGKEPAATFHGVEIMPACASLAKRSVRLNNLEKNIKIFCDDARSFAPPQSDNSLYDKIICNPPYKVAGSGRISPVAERAAAIFQLNGSAADFLQAAARLLKKGGKAFFVLPENSAKEAVKSAEAVGLHLQRLQTHTGKRQSGKAICLLELEK